MSCPDCFAGHVNPGTPTGTTQTLHSLTTYTALPPTSSPPKGIIVVVPDAFGIDFVNNKILADHYAAKGGYTVHLPDFMAGFSAPVGVLDAIRLMESPGRWGSKLWNVPYLIRTLVPWMVTNRFSASYPRVKTFLQALRAANPSVPIFIAGFCWGGKHLILLSADPEMHPVITAGFTGHPSALSIPTDIQTLNNPVSFAIGEHDSQVKRAAREEIGRLVEGKGGELVTYDGVGHGFCVRADSSRDDAKESAEKAEDQCLKWFDQHLPK